MGDRVLFQVVLNNEFSPVIYGHWLGYQANNIIQALENRMQGRP